MEHGITRQILHFMSSKGEVPSNNRQRISFTSFLYKLRGNILYSFMNGSYVEKTVTIKLSYRLFATVLQSIGLDILLYQHFLLLL